MALDLEALRKGSIPWNPKEFFEVWKWYCALCETPKDDWDLSDGPQIDIADDVGQIIERCGFNMLHPLNQLTRHITEDENGIYHENRMYHADRFTEITDFLNDNFDRLREDGFAFLEDGRRGFYHSLLEGLSVLPYSEPYTEDGIDAFRFSYDEVAAKARELRSKKQKEREEEIARLRMELERAKMELERLKENLPGEG